MPKIIKYFFKSSGILLEAVSILLILFAFLIRNSVFQTYLAKRASVYFSKEWKTKVRIDKVDISFFDNVSLQGFLLEDQKGKKLIAVKSAEVSIDDFGPAHLSIRQLKLNGGEVWVYADKSNGVMNFDFLTQYFASNDKSRSGKPFVLYLNSLKLNHTSFRYDDFRMAPSTFGVDPNHVYLQNMNLSLSQIKSKGSSISCHIDDLNLKDVSGTQITHLRSYLTMDDLSLKLSDFRLCLKNSEINAKTLQYRFNRVEDKSDFIHKAQLLCEITDSKIDFKDLSYLVPELKGMNEVIRIKATVSNAINRLKIRNLDLKIRENTKIKANLELIDFSNWDALPFKQEIVEAKIDMNEINAIHLPEGKTLNLGSELIGMGTIYLTNLNIRHNDKKLVIDPFVLKSNYGHVAMKTSLAFLPQNDKLRIFNTIKEASVVNLKNFELGKLLGNSNFGRVNGDLTLDEFTLDQGEITMTSCRGEINSAVINGHEYKNLIINNLNVKNNLAEIDAKLKDPNADVEISGTVDVSGKPNMNLEMKVQNINPMALGVSKNEGKFSGNLELKTSGSSLDEFTANVFAKKVVYSLPSQKKEMTVTMSKVSLMHSNQKDQLSIKSSMVDAEISGKVDVESFTNEVLYSCSRPLPSLLNFPKPKTRNSKNNIKAKIKIHDPEPFTKFILPNLMVSPGTEIILVFDAKKELLGLDVTSNQIKYDSLIFDNVRLTQGVIKDSIVANLNIGDFMLSDSLRFQKISFFSRGNNGVITSKLGWNMGKKNDTEINWTTSILSSTLYDLTFSKSNLRINNSSWAIENGGEIQVKGNSYSTNSFKIVNEKYKQEICLDGKLSPDKEDSLQVSLFNINVFDLSKLLGVDEDLSGTLNGYFAIHNPYEALTITSSLNLSAFKLNNQEIGDFNFFTTYNDKLSAVVMKGGVKYRGKSSIGLGGTYKLNEIDNNLELSLLFDNTDISFLNGFMDPQVVSNVKGNVKGAVMVLGNLQKPRLNGFLMLDNTSADFNMLGCKYTLDGKINVTESGFVANRPISCKDIEGNSAKLFLSVYHDNFRDFNYEVNLDFENKLDSDLSQLKSNKFMVLDTKYKEGEPYYGKAYAQGHAKISGSGSIVKVLVDLTTKKGSKVVFPMYGSSELDNESIIHFISKENKTVETPKKINYSGVDLQLGFNVTPDADIRIVFNEQTQDEIKAKTEGKLNLSLDAFNQMNLMGSLKLLPGSIYNFTLGPAKKPFEIVSGTILWKGDVEHADLDVITSYTIKNANLLELLPGQNNDALSRQKTQCLLLLKGDLVDPELTFKLDVPLAPEEGKALISRINSDKDELNRQFFSLMIFNKFQPLSGVLSANESAAYDLVESQINAALSQLSKNYQVKMDIGSSNVSTSVQKAFLNDRLIVSGSFGINNNLQGASSGGLTGDVSMEYLVNPMGTFRVNAFNRSNGNTVKENAGPFTQGAGLSYQEDFNNRKDFKLYQSVLDVFRKKENKVVNFNKPNRQKNKVPPETFGPAKNEENDE